jgi:membrane protein required for colicin V production
MPTIAFLDWFFLAVLLLSLLIGAWRGLVYELISLASWAAAFVLAQWFALDVAQQLPMAGAGESVRYAAGFALTFIVALFAGGLIAAIVKNLITAVGLAPVDRVLGAAFGLVRGFVLLLAIGVVVSVTPLKNSAWWAESVGGSALSLTLKGLKPALPQDFGKYL